MLDKYLSKYDDFVQGKRCKIFPTKWRPFCLDLSVLTVDTCKVDVNKRTSVIQSNSIFNA